jgi:hypothetical protein
VIGDVDGRLFTDQSSRGDHDPFAQFGECLGIGNRAADEASA